jgi:magnesium-protoporphyrin O-methyltransferase
MPTPSNPIHVERPMTCSCSATTAFTARQFDDKRARAELRAYHRRGPGPTTQRLLSGLRAFGAPRGTLLDVGAGIGVLTFELLKAGMDRADCVDLSPASIAIGRAEAARQGWAGKLRWREADFVTVAPELEPADVVSLDRVVCCYPEYRPLLEEAARHTRRFLALSYPRDRWFVRAALWVENAFRRVRGNPFRAFVHSPAALDTLLRQSGFNRRFQESTLAWRADIYARSAGRTVDSGFTGAAHSEIRGEADLKPAGA